MDNQSFAINQLNNLIQINRDRVQGYEKAIEEVGTEKRVTGIFRQNAIESRDMLTELTDTVNKLGGEPAHEGTTLGKVHRTWMDVKNTLTSGEKESVVENCVFGDRALVNAYAEVLDDDKENQIPGFARAALNKQRRKVELSLKHMERLEEIYEAKS